MNIIRIGYFEFLFTCIFATLSVAKPFTQIRAFNFDFDDNIFVTSAEILLWDPIHHVESKVSTAQWALMKAELGKSGKWKLFQIRPESLLSFGDFGSQGTRSFETQITEALAAKPPKWKGPSWNSFVKALARPRTQSQTTIITARQHSPDSILKGLAILKAKGLIASLPLRANIFPVGWPNLPAEYRAKSTAESKAKVMLALLDKTEHSPLPCDAALVENADGTGKAPLQLWGFSDDDFSNFSEAEKVLSTEVARHRWPHVKITLFFTGLNNPGEHPRSVVIKSNGEPRAASLEEREGMGF